MPAVAIPPTPSNRTVPAGNPVGGGADNASAQTALARICRDSWAPLYAFARRRGQSPHDAQDSVQGFFASLIGRGAHLRLEANRATVRIYLLQALKHYLTDTWRGEQARKRGGGRQFVCLDDAAGRGESTLASELASAAPRDEERACEWHWARSLLRRALAALEAEHAQGERARLLQVLRPFLTGGHRLPTPEEASARLGVPITTFRSQLSRLRARYRELLRAEVARTAASPAEVDGELRYLCDVLLARQ